VLDELTPQVRREDRRHPRTASYALEVTADRAELFCGDLDGGSCRPLEGEDGQLINLVLRIRLQRNEQRQPPAFRRHGNLLAMSFEALNRGQGSNPVEAVSDEVRGSHVSFDILFF